MLSPEIVIATPKDTVEGVKHVPPALERQGLGQVDHGVDLLQVAHPVLHVLLHSRRLIKGTI